MEPTTEDVYRGLSSWWTRHCKAFSMWFLSRNTEEQRAILLEACPDIPLLQPGTDANLNKLTLTELIVPDISLESFLGAQGKILVLFITRAVTHLEHTWLDDLRRLKKLKEQRRLPDLTNGSCSQLNIPHVDPQDVAENVCQVDPKSSPEAKAKILEWIETDRLVEIDVWMCLKLRRMTVSSFILALAEIHQQQVEDKPSPTASALIRAEVAQRQVALKKTQSVAASEGAAAATSTTAAHVFNVPFSDK
jgi:hypothetical protein